MRLPGINRVTLTDEALREAVEDMFNSGRQPGEDRIRVVSCERHYGGGATVDITTDAAPIPVSEVTMLEAA